MCVARNVPRQSRQHPLRSRRSCRIVQQQKYVAGFRFFPHPMPQLPVTTADDASLHWRQTRLLQWDFTLSSDRGEHASMTIDGSSAVAVARTASSIWSFQRNGSSPLVVTAHDGVHADVATLRTVAPIATLSMTDGLRQATAELRASDVHIAQWRLTNVLNGDAAWVTPDGHRLIAFRRGVDDGTPVDWMKTQTRVDFSEAGFVHQRRDLLVCLGWYLMTQVHNSVI
jgi:hypothetical protein